MTTLYIFWHKSHITRFVSYWLFIALILIAMYSIAISNAYADGNVPANAAASYPGLDPRLIGVPIIKTDTTAALIAYSKAVDRVAELETEKSSLGSNVEVLTAEIPNAKEQLSQRTSELNDIQSSLNLVIIARYEKLSTNNNAYDKELINEQRVTQQSNSVISSLKKSEKKAIQRKTQAIAYFNDVNTALSQTQTRQTTIDADIKAANKAAKDTKNIVRTGIPIALIEGLEIPVLSMDAYLRAEKTMTQTQPGCGLTWWSLAGIGRAESNHGRFRGAILDQNGTVTPSIIGVPLNGEGFAAIGDSDGGLLDGDPVWDHAVGVMQFIPGTWKRWGADGNGDGVIDPQNVYDAALGAARKLCADAGPNMSTPAGRRVAFLAYNNSSSYADFVEAKGKEYELIGAGRFNPAPQEPVLAQ